MELRRLKYFVRMVDAGSITKAANTLGMGQPALNQQVAWLENELRVRLPHRKLYGIETTAAGTELYRHARILVRWVDLLKQAIERPNMDLEGTVSIGMPPSITDAIAFPVLMEAWSRSPPCARANRQTRRSRTRGTALIPPSGPGIGSSSTNH